MSHAHQILLLLFVSLTLALTVTASGAVNEDTVDVALGWAPSPPHDSEGQPLAPAVMYRVYATKDGGPVSYLCEVQDDTLCTVELMRGAMYRVRVVGFDADLRASVPSLFSDEIYYAPDGDLTDVADLPATGAAIESTYPNPFNPVVRVRYAVGTGAGAGGTNIALDVLDVRGRLVRSLAAGPRPAGRHEAVWDGTGATGRRLPSGAYFVRLRSNSGQQIRCITLVK